MRTPVLERIHRHLLIDVQTGCWLWQGSVDGSGYPHIRSDDHTTMAKVHRVLYKHLRGSVPPDLELDHVRCPKQCVNPAHLEIVTHAENMRRYSQQLTHCKRGHLFASDNVVRVNGRRTCRTCRRISERRRQRHRYAL